MNKKIVLTFAVCSVLLFGFSKKSYSDEQLIKAIHKVESGGRTDKKIVGDNGKAIGPLQIHYANWKDATDFDKSIGGQYSNCHNLEYSKKIFVAYMNRYAKGKDAETKARIWNGGLKGPERSSTKQYWAKVKANL
jgi:hypothetical protein